MATGLSALILFEDEHLLVAHKPSGVNTHKPDRFAPDGLHEWLEKHGRKLSILQRLDKDTSGVIIFGKTRLANQSLSRQFESHRVEKRYWLLTTSRPTRQRFHATSPGAETEFEFQRAHGPYFLIQARPLTGKTHQIRKHAAANGFPIVGDAEYGGAPAPRLMLHAYSLSLEHPSTQEIVHFQASVPRAFDDGDPLVAACEFRELLFDEDTNAFRWMSSAADGIPGVIVDSYAGNLLAQWQTEAVDAALYERLPSVPVYEQICTKQKRTSPQSIRGALPERFAVRENGLTFLVSFGEGLSPGIFLDQRENRRRLLTMNLTGQTVLNCFAYTGAFSVAAARSGAVTTSVDLSRNYLAWGQANFAANGLDPGAHAFVAGDVFEWLRRFAQRRQTWNIVILDPPTFSTSKHGRAFQAERDYGALASLAMPLVTRGGRLLCSTNQRTLAPEHFEAMLQQAARACGRTIASAEFETQPWDFRVVTGEHPYLKTFWLQMDGGSRDPIAPPPPPRPDHRPSPASG